MRGRFASSMTVQLVSLVALSYAPPAHAGVPTCMGRPATIIGEGPPEYALHWGDVIQGTPYDDVIVGRGGRDIIRGGRGDDIICAGRGKEGLEFDLELVYGGRGDDVIDGGPNKDEVYGGRGRDIILGGRGKDFLVGGSDRDHLSGGEGNDTLAGGSDDDRHNGGEGDDYLLASSGADVFNGAGGTDTLHFARGEDSYDGRVGQGIVDLQSGTTSDFDTVEEIENVKALGYEVIGDEGANEIEASIARGGGGADHLIACAIAGIYQGGEGDDTFSWSCLFRSQTVTVDGGGGSNSVTTPWIGPAFVDLASGAFQVWNGSGRLTYIQSVTGSSYDDTLYGDDADNLLDGGQGQDVVDGRGGTDVCLNAETVANCEG